MFGGGHNSGVLTIRQWKKSRVVLLPYKIELGVLVGDARGITVEVYISTVRYNKTDISGFTTIIWAKHYIYDTGRTRTYAG